MASDDRVVLNIGGTRFEVPKRTLAKHPDTLLGVLVTSGDDSAFEREANGEYFFDRNGRFFEFILEFYRSGTIHPPTDMPTQRVLAELEFWRVNPDTYLASLEDQSKIRGFVEAPVETPLDQLDPEEILDRLTELPPAERLRTCTEFIRHTDTDLIQVGLRDLSTLLAGIEADSSLQASPLHIEVLSFLALGHYRLGQISKARIILNTLLKYEPDNKQANDLLTLVNDSSLNYTKLGLFAFGTLIFGIATLKVWSWTSAKSRK